MGVGVGRGFERTPENPLDPPLSLIYVMPKVELWFGEGVFLWFTLFFSVGSFDEFA